MLIRKRNVWYDIWNTFRKFIVLVIEKEKLSEEIVEGHLMCIDCIYNENCEDVNDRCVANYIYNDDIVHIKDMEKQ